jgi:hypothetical protein
MFLAASRVTHFARRGVPVRSVSHDDRPLAFVMAKPASERHARALILRVRAFHLPTLRSSVSDFVLVDLEKTSIFPDAEL